MPTTERTHLNIEVPRELKIRLRQYADEHSLSQAAAARLLLDAALVRAGYPREAAR